MFWLHCSPSHVHTALQCPTLLHCDAYSSTTCACTQCSQYFSGSACTVRVWWTHACSERKPASASSYQLWRGHKLFLVLPCFLNRMPLTIRKPLSCTAVHCAQHRVCAQERQRLQLRSVQLRLHARWQGRVRKGEVGGFWCTRRSPVCSTTCGLHAP